MKCQDIFCCYLIIKECRICALIKYTEKAEKMSNDITLSDQLIDNLYGVICQHDESAKKNMMVALQYFAAVSGYMLGDYPGSDDEREELIDQLADFTKHVSGDRVKSQKAQEQSKQEEAPAVVGKSVTTDDPAVGIWKPE